jgi:hypothetical protein
MREEKLVQFACFETPLDTDDFIVKWEQYIRPANSDTHVTIQQSKKNGVFRYVVQYRCVPGQFQFNFKRERRSSKIKQIPVRAEQAGGYSILELGRRHEAEKDESKLFAFFIDRVIDLTAWRNMDVPCDLNIYVPYYENCRYTNILEFFTKDKWAETLLDQLKQHGAADARIYKECVMHFSNRPALH